MRDTLRLLNVVGKVALLFAAGCLLPMISFAVLFPRSTWIGRLPRVSSTGGVIAMAVAILVPAGLTRWWMLGRLSADYSRREARSVANAFAVLGPVLLTISLALSPLVGGYAGLPLGSESRLAAFAGAMAGVAVLMIIMAFALSVFVLWLVGRIRRAEQ
jgi:hypothetical protein